MDTENLIRKIKATIRPSYWLTPLNLREERNKFFKTGKNPQFMYPEIPVDLLKKFQTSVQSIELPEVVDLKSHLLRQNVKELLAVLALVLARDSEEFSYRSEALYGCSFQEKYLNAAKNHLNLPVTFKDIDSATVAETVNRIREYLHSLGLTDWALQVVPHTSFYFRIVSKKQVILVSEELRWDFASLDSTLAHEIDGHVLRAVNMKNAPVAELRKPTPFYIRTEEGLACYLMDFHSNATMPGLKHHAIKYLAGSLARTTSFADVFDFCRQYGFPKELAFLRTQKLKRGLADTSKPGLFAKEAVYYEGMLDIKAYLENGGELTKLYSGKIGLADIPFIITPKNPLLPARLVQTN